MSLTKERLVPDMDRDYTDVAKTFDAPGVDAEEFTAKLSSLVMPGWQRLYSEGVLASALAFHKERDVDMQTSSCCVPDCRYFVLLELSADADKLLDTEREAGLTVVELARQGAQYLSNEVLIRPAFAGTAVPLPSPYWPAPPPERFATRRATDGLLNVDSGWLATQYAAASRRDVRFCMEVGTWEGCLMLLPNRMFRDVLRAKEYSVLYREFEGGHEYFAWRATLADGLLALLPTGGDSGGSR